MLLRNKKNIKNLILKIEGLKKTGFFALVLSNFINKILAFCNGIILIRILSQKDYGIYSYYQNSLMFFLFMSGFGCVGGFLQFGSKKISITEEEKYFKFSIKYGIMADLLLALIIFLISFSNNFYLKGSINYLKYMSFIPFFTTIIDLIITRERVRLNNQRVAFLSNMRTILDVMFLLIGAYFYGIIGVIIGKYIGQILTILIAFKTYESTFKNWSEIEFLSFEKKQEIKKFSYVSVFNSVIAQLLYVIDIFLIGYLIKDEVLIANYKTATLIPFALNFLPQLISNYLYPYFSRNSDENIYIKSKYLQLLKYNSILNLLITLFLISFSSIIIRLCFGEKYLDIKNLFNLFAVGYFFAATLRIPGGYILSALGKLKYITYNSLICAIINIILDIILIKKYGTIGAAYVTVLIFIISGFLSNIFLWRVINRMEKE